MSADCDMQFSAVVPLYNKQEHIAQCIGSILDQTHQAFEIVVVDDASTDGGFAVVQNIADPRLVLIQRGRSGPGPSGARNMGIAKAKYPWCAFLDADDMWNPNYLHNMAEAIRAAPETVGFLFSGFRNLFPDGTTTVDNFSSLRADKTPVLFDFASFLRVWLENHNAPNRTSATVIRTDILRAIKGFSEHEQCKRGQDKDVWLRAMARTKAAYVPIIGMDYRTGSMSEATKASWFDQPPCLSMTIHKMLGDKEMRPHRRALRRLLNDEIFGYVKEGSRAGPLKKTVFKGFYIRENPLLYLLILAIWALPNWLLRFLRKGWAAS